MEDIIQILFYIGIAVIAIVSRITNNKEKPATSSPKDVLEDEFPCMESVKQEEPTEVLPPQPTCQEFVVPEQTLHQADPIPPASPKPMQKVRINTREEARRAFIHSEIFNRKY